jgi:hypothetical protein
MRNPFPHARIAGAHQAALRAQRGSAILGIIALMVMVSVLGVALLTSLSSSSEQTLVTDGGNQAFFMAESGARYAVARILQGGEAAATALDGQRFTLAGGSAFDLAIEVQHPTGLTRYCIDATGISGVGTPAERHTLNGYVINIAATPAFVSPVAFNYAALVTGSHAVSLNGSSYIDSFNSNSTATRWTRRGQYNDGTVSVNLNTNAADLDWSTAIYGDLRVGAAADLQRLTNIVNRPGNILGDLGIVPSPAVSVTAVSAPADMAEVAVPTSLTNMPGFSTRGSQTIAGGNYRVNGDFETGSADLTLSSSTYMLVGDDHDHQHDYDRDHDHGNHYHHHHHRHDHDDDSDLNITSGGSLTVNGNFAATVADDLHVKGDTRGLTVQGNASLWVSGDVEVASGSGMNVTGTLDLEMGDDFEISGGSSVVLSGDADIDVPGSFELTGGASLYIGGKVVLRVGEGFRVSGGSEITFGPNGSLQVYVQDGEVEIASVDINPGGSANRFLVICDPAVSDVEITGSAQVYAGIYAPGAEVEISGSSALFGAVVGHRLDLSGSAALHYDQALQGSSGATADDLTILRRFWVATGD